MKRSWPTRLSARLHEPARVTLSVHASGKRGRVRYGFGLLPLGELDVRISLPDLPRIKIILLGSGKLLIILGLVKLDLAQEKARLTREFEAWPMHSPLNEMLASFVVGRSKLGSPDGLD